MRMSIHFIICGVILECDMFSWDWQTQEYLIDFVYCINIKALIYSQFLIMSMSIQIYVYFLSYTHTLTISVSTLVNYRDCHLNIWGKKDTQASENHLHIPSLFKRNGRKTPHWSHISFWTWTLVYSDRITCLTSELLCMGLDNMKKHEEPVGVCISYKAQVDIHPQLWIMLYVYPDKFESTEHHESKTPSLRMICVGD